MVSFRNLGRDACLVVPCNAGTDGGVAKGKYNYAHLAAFVRTAPAEQVFVVSVLKQLLPPLVLITHDRPHASSVLVSCAMSTAGKREPRLEKLACPAVC